MGRHWSSLLDPTHVLDNPTQHFPNKQDPTRASKTRTQRHCQSDRGHRQVFSAFLILSNTKLTMLPKELLTLHNMCVKLWCYSRAVCKICRLSAAFNRFTGEKKINLLSGPDTTETASRWQKFVTQPDPVKPSHTEAMDGPDHACLWVVILCTNVRKHLH